MKKSSKIRYLLFWATVIILAISLAGYVRLYLAIAEKRIAISYSGALPTQEKSIIEKKTFGYSTKGKPIEGYVIGEGNNTILLFSSIHGDEVGTTDLLNQFVDEIKANEKIVSKENKLIIIPILNPDGYYDRFDKLNANRVNLNLNFDTNDWKKYGPEGTYAGPEPFSEIESQALRQAVQDYKPNMMIAYHSSGALVSPENDETSMILGKWYAEKTGYSYYDSANLDWDYPGTATKWFVQSTGKPAITIELTHSLKSDWEINKQALIKLALLPINATSY